MSKILEAIDYWTVCIQDELLCIRDTYREIRNGDDCSYPCGKSVAATMYQTVGAIDSELMPDGEWLRIMDWLADVSGGVAVEPLLLVGAVDCDVSRAADGREGE